MPRLIEVPGHGLIEFPDELSDDQIASAIKSNFDGSAAIGAAAPTVQAPTLPSTPEEVQHPPAAQPGFFGGLKEGFAKTGEQPSELVPFLGGAVEAKRLWNVYEAAKRVEAGTDTEDDITLLRTLHEENSKQRGRAEGIGYGVARVLSQLPAFAGEILTTGGIYTAGRKVTQEAVLKTAGKLIENAAEKAAVKYAARIAGGVAGAALQTIPATAPRIVGGAIERMTPQIGGESGREVIQPGEDFTKAVAKSLGDNFVEVLSERSGGMLTGAASKIPGVNLLTGLQKAIAERWLKKTGGTLDTLLEKVQKGTGWHGVIGEVLEERAGEVGRAALGVEPYKPPTVDQLITEAVAFSVPGAARGALNRVLGGGQQQTAPEIPADVKTALDQQRAAEKSTSAEMFRGLSPHLNIDVPHVNEIVGRTLNADGVPIGVIVGADPVGFLVAREGQFQPTVVPYANLNLRPGIDVRAPFAYDTLVGRTFDNGGGDIATITKADDKGITIRTAAGAEVAETYRNLGTTPLDVYDRTQAAAPKPVEPAVQPTPPVQPAVKPAEPVNTPVTPVTESAPPVTPPAPEQVIAPAPVSEPAPAQPPRSPKTVGVRRKAKPQPAPVEAPKPEPAPSAVVDTIAGRMDLSEFERKGYAPEQVTREDWVNLQRAERRRLGQPEGGDNKNAPWVEYENFHRDAVKAAIDKGETVDPEVLKDYPDLTKAKEPTPPPLTPEQQAEARADLAQALGDEPPAKAPEPPAKPATVATKVSRTTPEPGTPEREKWNKERSDIIDKAQAAYEKSSSIREQRQKVSMGTKKYESLGKQIDKADDAYSALKPASDKARKEWQQAGLEDIANENIPIASTFVTAELEARQLEESGNANGARKVRNDAWDKMKSDLEAELQKVGLTPSEAKDEATSIASMLNSYPLAESRRLNERFGNIAKRVQSQRGLGEIRKEFDAIESPVMGTERDRFRIRIFDRDITTEQATKILSEYKAWVAERTREARAAEKAEREKEAADVHAGLLQAREWQAKGTLHWIAYKDRWAPVEGKEVNLPGVSKISAFIRKVGDHWVVTEERSGMSIGQAKLRADAIKTAADKIKAAAPDLIENQIKKAEEKLGPRPDLSKLTTEQPAGVSEKPTLEEARLTWKATNLGRSWKVEVPGRQKPVVVSTVLGVDRPNVMGAQQAIDEAYKAVYGELSEKNIAPAPPPKPEPATTQAAVAKVEKQVEKVATTEGQRPAKEVKSDLVSKLEAALAAAPSVNDFPLDKQKVLQTAQSGDFSTVGNFQYGKRGDAQREAAIKTLREKRNRDAEAAGFRRIIVDIPGDGEFTLWNTKEAIGEVLDAARRIKTGKESPSRPGGGRETASERLKSDAADAITVYGSEANAYRKLSAQLERKDELGIEEEQATRIRNLLKELQYRIEKPVREVEHRVGILLDVLQTKLKEQVVTSPDIAKTTAELNAAQSKQAYEAAKAKAEIEDKPGELVNYQLETLKRYLDGAETEQRIAAEGNRVMEQSAGGKSRVPQHQQRAWDYNEKRQTIAAQRIEFLKGEIQRIAAEQPDARHAVGWVEVPGDTDQRFLTPEEVQAAIADMPRPTGVEFQIVNSPEHREYAGGFGFPDGKPRIFLNAAGLTSAEQARQTLREESGHALLSSPEGRKLVMDFALDRMTDAERERLNYGLYARRQGESAEQHRIRMADEFIAKAGREKNGFWREFVERVKAWFASKGLGTLTNEEAARAILRKLARDARDGRLEMASLPEEAVRYSLNPVASPEEFRKVMVSAEDMRREDALHNAKVFHVENATTAGLVREEFLKLPEQVRDALPMLQGRIQAMASAEAAATKYGGSAPAAGGALREVVERMSPNRQEQAQAVFASMVNMLDLLDAAAKYRAKVAELEAELQRQSEDFAKRAPTEIAESLARRIIDLRRGQLLERRSSATDPEPINAELEFWQNRAAAVANVLEAIAKAVPVDVLRNPNDPKAILSAIPEGTDFHANSETVEAVKRAASEFPTFNILAIREPSKSPEHVALEERVATMRQGLTFLDDLTNSQQFKENYEQAVDLTGSRALVAKTNPEGDLVYENPYDHTQSVTISKGFDQQTYKDNVAALEQAREWFQAYLDDPKADPLKKAGIEAQLWAIDHVHLSQQFDPKTGKLLAGGFNPFSVVMRFLGGAADIPEYTTQMAGGRESSYATRDVQNYANARQAIINSHLRERLKASVATRDAAKAREMDIATYQGEIVNEILGSYQNRGDVRLRAGDKVRGHTLTPQDVAAAQAQKAYFDALNQSVRALEKTTVQGKASPIKTRDVVGDFYFERDPQATSELMVPQRLKGNAIAFKDKWTAIRDNSGLSDTEKVRQWEALLDGEFLEDALLGHVESFRNPSYVAEIKSPFRAEYLQLHRERDDTGKSIKSLDDLAERLFESQIDLPPEEQLSHDQIKAQVLKEIGKAVSAFEADESKVDKLFDPDRSQVRVISAENFMNRPRGQRLLPKGFYTYTVGTDVEQTGVQFHILQVFAQRVVNSLSGLRDALSKQVGEFQEQLKKGATEDELRSAQKSGDNFLNVAEAKTALAMVHRQLNAFTGFMTQKQGQELQIYNSLNLARSVAANAILQRFPTMLGNWLGAPFQRTLLDMAVLNTGRNMLSRFWPIGGTYYTIKNITLHGKATVDAAIGMILNQPEVGPKAKALADYLRTNSAYWAKFAGFATDYLMRQKARVEYLKEAGAMEEDPWRHNIEAIWKFGTEGGRLTDQKRSVLRKAYDLTKTAVMLFNETGGLLQLPRAVGVVGVDTVNNSIADGVAKSLVNNLILSSERAFSTRGAAGYDPRKSILTAQEVFGRKGASQRDLAEIRSLFDRAGLNLDRTLLEYWQKKQAGPVDAIQDVLGFEKYNSLVMEIAKFLNKGTFSNRPFYNTPLARAAGLFLGYGFNQNAILARLFSAYSRDTRNPLWQGSELFLKAAAFIFLVALFGDLYQPAVAWLKSFFYKEENAIKPIWKANTIGEAARIQLQNSAFILPMVGRVLMNTVGAAAPGMTGSAFGIQLFPVSAAQTVVQAVSRMFQTGEIARPLVDLSRSFIPNSRVILNRTSFREGTLTEQNVRAALVANAPKGVDVKTGFAPRGTQVYSPARPYVDSVVNALSLEAGPDMATVAEQRRKGIAVLVEAGKSQEDAAQSFDRSIISRNPFISAFGRNLTAAEMQELRSTMSEGQRKTLDRFIAGRRAYAQAYGLSDPDFIRDNDSGAPPADLNRQINQQLGFPKVGQLPTGLPSGVSGVRRGGTFSASVRPIGASERSEGMNLPRTPAAAPGTGLSGMPNTGLGGGLSAGAPRIRRLRGFRRSGLRRGRGVRRSTGRITRGKRLAGVRRGFGKLRLRRV